MTAQGTMLTDEAIREAAVSHVAFYCDVEQGAMEPETKAWAEGIYRAGARFAQGIYEARLAEDAKVRAQLVEALQDLLAYAESQICSHEETHRGGAIWEICDICGDCWADDDGGKPPRQDPEEIVATRSALLAAAKERG